MNTPENIKLLKMVQERELAREFFDAPNGTRLGMHWDYNRKKLVPFIKDHFTGAIRPAIMKDNMYDNMSKEKLEEHRQYHLQRQEQQEEEKKNSSSSGGK
ncbi:hypothetical protein F5Y00DRAFT_261236 [Daldinia vernicosa]|uniref:uncharacterized protein n=1 Tax=Daldinia vernicosa TaxID=114800 RepID=UPI0020088D2A|nr:uncharacterized protein F5Y00DRAFT_261236 [Daldinia vernicosa]KAI0849790.1 hypothetical protein F5Y00DRAFT_261236 [Daldinia vernicosa]